MLSEKCQIVAKILIRRLGSNDIVSGVGFNRRRIMGTGCVERRKVFGRLSKTTTSKDRLAKRMRLRDRLSTAE